MGSDGLLSAEECVLLVVDVQEAFVGHVAEMERVIERSEVMIRAARLLGLPIVVSEQYPDGLGATVKQIAEALGDCRRYAKTSFSCWGDPAVKEAIQATGRKEVLLVGIETHVCIAQTALGLAADGFRAAVAVDAVSSRRESDAKVALERMARAGVVLTTTEAAIMEMTVSSKHPAFREISKLIK